MHLRSACCRLCKYLSSQDFLCFKQMRSSRSARLAKQTESLVVWFKLQHQWKFMSLLVSLVMSTSDKYLMDLLISEKHCLVGRRSCRVARPVCKEHQTRSGPKCMRLNSGRHYKPRQRRNAKNGPTFPVVSLVKKVRSTEKYASPVSFWFYAKLRTNNLFQGAYCSSIIQIQMLSPTQLLCNQPRLRRDPQRETRHRSHRF